MHPCTGARDAHFNFDLLCAPLDGKMLFHKHNSNCNGSLATVVLGSLQTRTLLRMPSASTNCLNFIKTFGPKT